jgi:hypothetical protein
MLSFKYSVAKPGSYDQKYYNFVLELLKGLILNMKVYKYSIKIFVENRN